MSDKNITPFDQTVVIENEVRPLLNQLTRVCTVNSIPMYVLCCVRNDENSSEYVTTGVMADTADIKLKDDKISKVLKVMLGFEPIYKARPEPEQGEEGDSEDFEFIDPKKLPKADNNSCVGE